MIVANFIKNMKRLWLPVFHVLGVMNSLAKGFFFVGGSLLVVGTLQAQSDYATPYSFTTLAGTAGTSGTTDGVGAAARFSFPYAVAVGPLDEGAGTMALYVADAGNQTIRRILSYGTSALVSTLAGKAGQTGFVDGTGNAALFDIPSALAVDTAGNIYVADTGNHAIRKITPIGTVTTLAGGTAGGLDGVGTAAKFLTPNGIAVDSAGNVYVADTANSAIREITPAGVVTTLAGSFSNPGSADGTGSLARFNSPFGVAVDSAGNVYVADRLNTKIRKITPAGVTTTLAGPPTFLSGDTDGTGTAARFASPIGVAVDGNGNVFVADSTNCSIRKVTAGGVVTTLAGSTRVEGGTDGTGSNVRFNGPQGIAVDPYGNLYVADTDNNVIRVSVVPPTISLQPLSQVVTVGGQVFLYSEVVSNSPFVPTTFQWERNGVLIFDGNGLPIGDSENHEELLGIDPYTTLDLRTIETTDLASYVVIATNFAGSVTSDVAVLSSTPPPNFTAQPVSVTSAPGASVTFTAGATAVALPIAYQWQKDGVPIPGATTNVLVLNNVQASDLGSYTLVATNSSGSTTSNPAVLSFVVSTDSRIVNLSIRANAGTGAQTLIVGFVVGGASTTGPKPLLIRGAGPALGPFGVSGFVADPALTVYSGSSEIAANDNWGGDAQVTTVSTQVGAFSFGSATSLDAALFSPAINAGPYTAQITGVGGATGIALAEIYDATPANAFTGATPRLINVSARAQVGTDSNILIAGFVVQGATTKTLLIRAVGPTLANFGVTGVLADPKLDLYSGSTLLQSNDNWNGVPAIASAAATVGAFSLDPASKDAVLLVSVVPGAYTVQISGVGGATGVALAEVYEMP
jgi:sugar lactone lactonase YvrE